MLSTALQKEHFWSFSFKLAALKKKPFFTKILSMQKVSEQLSWQSLCMLPTAFYCWKSGNSDLSSSLRPPRDLDPSAIDLIQALQLYDELSCDEDETAH